MYQFIIKIFSLATLIALCIGLLLYSHPYQRNYLASGIDKHKLLETTKSPRIILIGGSNLAYGINSEGLSDAFGRPVINMGLHAGLGLKYMINEVQPHLRQDDWIIFSPEYHQFYGNLLDGEEALGELMVIEPRFARYLSAEQYVNTLSNSLGYLSSVARHNLYMLLGISNASSGNKHGLYSREAYNDWGDLTAHLKMPDTETILPRSIKGDRNYRAEQVINQFTHQVTQKGVKVFMLYPSYLDKSYQMNKAKIDILTMDLSNKLQAKIIAKPEDFLFDQSLLFDTEYHLNARGVQMRTEKVIAFLAEEKNLFQDNGNVLGNVLISE